MTRTKRITTGRWRAAVGAVTLLVALAVPGAASAADRNHDSIPDRWERAHGLSLKKDQAGRDQDRDALRNRDEYRSRMDPRDDDSDDDGIEDGEEGAGTIASFDEESGLLRIDLFNGDRISGVVTEETKIECDHEDGDKDEEVPHPPKEEEPPPPPKEEETLPPPKEEPETARHEEGDDEGDEEECSTGDLVPGAVVQEAQLYLEHGEAFWKEVELRR